MPSSDFDKILDDVVGIVQGLSLALVAQSAVKKRMLPRVGEPPLPGKPPWVIVAPGEGPIEIDGEEFEAIDTGYAAEIAVVYPANGDFSSMLPQFAEWRQLIVNEFEDDLELPTATNVVDIRVLGKPLFDRGLLAQQYGYVSVPVLFVARKMRR